MRVQNEKRADCNEPLFICVSTDPDEMLERGAVVIDSYSAAIFANPATSKNMPRHFVVPTSVPTDAKVVCVLITINGDGRPIRKPTVLYDVEEAKDERVRICMDEDAQNNMVDVMISYIDLQTDTENDL